MRILYCNDDLQPRSIDTCFEAESQTATASGLAWDLIDFNAIRARDSEAVVRLVKTCEHLESAVYRGWMLTPDEYELLYSSLAQRRMRLFTSPDEYLHCHWFPNSYSVIQAVTPFSIWVPMNANFNLEDACKALDIFGASPLIVKDYVKSRKHEWNEACFIPDASNRAHVKQVVQRFIELQAEDLQGGLVFRKFMAFQPVSIHPKSTMPLTLEYRLFVVDGAVVVECPYWDEASYTTDLHPSGSFTDVLTNVKSRFFSCDVALTSDGNWSIVELGDGQVSGLPARCEVSRLYDALALMSP